MRPFLKALSTVIIVFVSLLVTGCSGSQSKDAPVDSRANASATSGPVGPIEDGHALFLANCTGCHGKNADGNTPAGKAWSVPDLRSQQVQAMSDQQLTQIIRQGRGRMPAWGGLFSPIDIEHLLTYVRSLPKN